MPTAHTPHIHMLRKVTTVLSGFRAKVRPCPHLKPVQSIRAPVPQDFACLCNHLEVTFTQQQMKMMTSRIPSFLQPTWAGQTGHHDHHWVEGRARLEPVLRCKSPRAHVELRPAELAKSGSTGSRPPGMRTSTTTVPRSSGDVSCAKEHRSAEEERRRWSDGAASRNVQRPP